ncbi:hypothetical protein L3Q72_20770 [Vibrio sp. JC009]|uniref:hypothetical protein n=1 Tax=Vibrio sp. JC009 TaxID=2912314 RepID=UPI0023B19750|nr:hypothetical protein [Vibrio sp. JC009]WED23671.1 hypothetical protein L3Q72_20770 [Vibrio sp. JC009]
MSDTLSLVVLDSGLGGLSVLADLAEKISKSSPKPIVNLTFFNAWPSLKYPYNLMSSQELKTKVFSDALYGTEAFNPEKVLIACNTLSVLLGQTEFARESDTKAVGIIEYGVNSILDKLTDNPDSKVLIAATPTTIEANTHKEALLKAGIKEERIITQSYGRLAEKIESDPDSDIVRELIEQYTQEAKTKAQLGEEAKLYAALCCTHYGYSMTGFQDSLNSIFNRHVEILNPNDAMSEGSIPATETPLSDVTINIKVVSRVPIEEDKIESIGAIIKRVSPATEVALRQYLLDENLFNFDTTLFE